MLSHIPLAELVQLTRPTDTRLCFMLRGRQ